MRIRRIGPLSLPLLGMALGLAVRAHGAQAREPHGQEPEIAAPARAASTLTPEETQSLVERAIAAEVRSAQDTSHPMRYRLRKISPRLTTTKELVETRDGQVARLVSINDAALSPEDERKEQTRLNGLLADPALQRHRRDQESEDQERAMKVLRALPTAFLYQFAGIVTGPQGDCYRLTFTPNPRFESPNLETQALRAMTGELWIDRATGRAVHLEGRIQQDVDFGWGVLGRLNKGGTIQMEQNLVAPRQWRIVRLEMVMSGRVLFRAVRFDTVEEQSQFALVPPGLSYQQGIQMLREGDSATSPANGNGP